MMGSKVLVTAGFSIHVLFALYASLVFAQQSEKGTAKREYNGKELQECVAKIDELIRLAMLSGETKANFSQTARSKNLGQAIDQLDQLIQTAAIPEPEADHFLATNWNDVFKRAALLSFRLDLTGALMNPSELVEKALKWNPRDIESRLLQAEILLDGVATPDYLKATSLRLSENPSRPDGVNVKRAKDLLLVLVKEENPPPEAFWGLREVYRREGDKPNAKAVFFQWLEALPQFSLLLNWYEDQYPTPIFIVMKPDGKAVIPFRKSLPKELINEALTNSLKVKHSDAELENGAPDLPAGDYLNIDEDDAVWITGSLANAGFTVPLKQTETRLVFANPKVRTKAISVVCVAASSTYVNDVWAAIPTDLIIQENNNNRVNHVSFKRLETQTPDELKNLLFVRSEKSDSSYQPRFAAIGMARSSNSVWYLVFHEMESALSEDSLTLDEMQLVMKCFSDSLQTK